MWVHVCVVILQLNLPPHPYITQAFIAWQSKNDLYISKYSVCVCVCVCVYVCVYVCMCVRVHAYMCMYTFMSTYVYVYICTHMYTCVLLAVLIHGTS